MIRESAPAKINLALRVLGRRADGYHALESLVAFADETCADAVILAPPDAPPDAPPAAVTVDGPYAAAIVGENLLARTMAALAAAAPNQAWPPVRLVKALPVAAGLGGGSADAAALLRAARHWLHAHDAATAARVDWHAMAQALGSDVPVCLAGMPAVISGRGETVTPIPALAPLSIVLANPATSVPVDKTAQVFRALAAPPLPPASSPSSSWDPATLADRDAVIALMAAVGNDLTSAAMRVMPVVGDVLQALRQVPGCRHAQMAGAGPTGLAVFDDDDAAAAAARALSAHAPHWWVRATRLASH